MQGGRDPAADLAEEHLPLAAALARRYVRSGEALDDLEQVASVGLIAAARRFDARRRVPFPAYAARTIEGELRRHLRDRTSTIRIPRREQAVAAGLRRSREAISQELGHEASLAEVAAATGVALEEARVAAGAARPPASLAAAGELSSPQADEELEGCERRALVQALLAVLDPFEREVVALRFGGDLSQPEIARRLGISQSTISRLLAGALEKLRRVAEGLDRAA